MAANSLVAASVDMSTPFSGTFLLEDGEALVQAIQSGDWVSGGLAAFSAIADTVAAVMDPLGSLIAAGLGWIMEHLEPLKGWLNDLTGDAGEVAGFAATWANIGASLAASGDNLVSVLGDLDASEGDAIDAYRRFQQETAEHLRAAGGWAEAIGVGMNIAATIVKIVHDLTRDAIAQIVGSVISYAATLVITLGTATPLIISQATSRVSSLSARIGKTVTRLLESAKQLTKLIDQLATLFKRFDAAAGRMLPGGRTPDAPGARSPELPGGRSPDGPGGHRPGDGHVDMSSRPDPTPFPDDPPTPTPIDPSLVDWSVVNQFDPRTGDGNATFWSGRVRDGDDIVPDGSQVGAARLTDQTHGATLEQLLERQGLTDRMPSDWDAKSTQQTWAEVSSQLARNSSGDVRAYVGDIRPASVWNQYELPELLHNPNVSSITLIDAHTGKIIQVYER
ncbi:hypothetical protein WJX64_12055 [Leifsonia sp. YIM 134122]|uniref:Uncharacterized protein n=1 Tax=Leifsonia stereocauli TaxID=3134136 RepID=A0ABU9W5K1_9MICO